MRISKDSFLNVNCGKETFNSANDRMAMNTKIVAKFEKKKEVTEDCKKWAMEIEKSYKPDLIIFIAKSGFLFGSTMSEYFNCPLVDIVVGRPGNRRMDMIKKMIPKVPGFLLSKYLIYKVSKNGYANESTRIIKDSKRLDELDINSFKRILLVDDSADTGWSLIRVKDYIKEKKFTGECRIACYSVLSQSSERIKVDYYRYRDHIIITATSRYSEEYEDFLSSYNKWKSEYRATLT